VLTFEILLRLQDLTSDNAQFGYRNVVPAVAHALQISLRFWIRAAMMPNACAGVISLGACFAAMA
jgi:hypothetical protein